MNDIHGHAHGDELLVCVARRLQSVLRKGDVLARLSGDEFSAIIETNDKDEVERFCVRILELFRAPTTVNEQSHYVSLSIGASLFPEHARDAATLLEQADQAMYSAKRFGRSCHQLYDSDLAEQTLLEERIAQQLFRSLAESPDEFTVVYQPHYMLNSGEVTGIEALLRWHHPSLGTVPPDRFIPIAEQRGWMASISELVLAYVQKDLQSEQTILPMGIRLAINVSARHLLEASFVPLMIRMRRVTDRLNWELELEITETTLADLGERLSSRLAQLQQEGIRIAIDDFGTGYSSLAYLQSLPINVLKVDRSFVAKIGEARADTRLVRAILAMAHALELEVVAEGIETETQRLTLRQLGCQHGQGYGFAKPQPWSSQLFMPLT